MKAFIFRRECRDPLLYWKPETFSARSFSTVISGCFEQILLAHLQQTCNQVSSLLQVEYKLLRSHADWVHNLNQLFCSPLFLNYLSLFLNCFYNWPSPEIIYAVIPETFTGCLSVVSLYNLAKPFKNITSFAWSSRSKLATNLLHTYFSLLTFDYLSKLLKFSKT